MFWYQQRDFLSLIREFSGGKLKQKGFFHSVASGKHLVMRVELRGPILSSQAGHQLFGSARSIFIERGLPAEREIGERETKGGTV